ncbi:MAG: hypothetical protein RL376_1233 [Verrucomicrobiota bacterium]|jgi:hypothetical protein
MRRVSALFALCAWLLASGAHWDFVQGFAWGRMIAAYSRTMPLEQAIKLTFTADNLCGVCEFVAEGKTRSDALPSSSQTPAPGETMAKAKPPIAPAPEHLFVFCPVSEPKWPTEHFLPDANARPAPPVEPPRAA